MSTTLQLTGLNRRLRDCFAAVLVVFLLSPPAAAPAGVVRDARHMPLCREVDDLLGPWPASSYLALPGSPLMAAVEAAPRPHAGSAADPGARLVATCRRLARVSAAGLLQVVDRGRAIARRLEAWLAAGAHAAPALGPEPAPFDDVLHGGLWVRTSMASPPASVEWEPAEVETPVLARFADIVLPMEPAPRVAALTWPMLTRDSTEVLLKMIAITFIATVLLVPTACSATARAMYASPRDGPDP